MADSRRNHWLVGEGFDGSRSYRSPKLTYGGKIRVDAEPCDAEGAAVAITLGNLRFDLTVREAREVAEWLGMAVEVVEAARG